MKLRNLKTVLLCIGIACCALQAQAQVAEGGGPGGGKEMPREVPNPEKMARKEAGCLKQQLGLTGKQYKKVYKLLLKEQRELFENRMPRPPHGGAEGMRPPMREGGMMGGEMFAGENRMPPPPMRGEAPDGEDMKKRVEKKNKKMKKILTESQYDKWLGMGSKPAPDPRKHREEKED